MTAQLHVFPHSSSAVEPEIRPPQEPVPPSASAPVRSRRMLLLERTMYRDGLAPFTSLFTVKLRGELSEPRLRRALEQLQAKHPLLRSVVEEGDDGPRFVLRHLPAPIPLRIVHRKTGLDWEREATSEWIAPFGSAWSPLVRVVWLRGSGVHELMLVAHHAICDGPSGMTLLRDCLAACDDPAWKPHAYDSLGGIEDLVPEELLRKRAFRLRVRRRSAVLRLGLLAKATRRTASRRRIVADQMYFHRWQLDPAGAAILIERCRKEDVTVLAAASVAFVQAFRQVRGADAVKHAYTMVNARRFLPRLHEDALFGMAPGVEMRIPEPPHSGEMPVSDFWQSARAIREDLTKRIDRLGNRFFESLAALESLHDRYPRLIADTEAAPAVRHITFSNLGRLDLQQQYCSFRIEHVYSPLVMVSPSPANTVVLSSIGGVLEFAIISDEESLPQVQAHDVREKAMAILRNASAIALQAQSVQDSIISARGAATT